MTILITILLVIAFLIVGCLVGYIYARRKSEKEIENNLRELGEQKEITQKELAQLKEKLEQEAEESKKRSLEGSRSAIKGRISENLALIIPDFQKQHPDLKISEAKFMGEPIDYLFFEGIDKKNITKVIFLEVKSGQRSHLNETETSLKNVIDDAEHKGANVIWREYVIHDSEAQINKPSEQQ